MRSLVRLTFGANSNTARRIEWTSCKSARFGVATAVAPSAPAFGTGISHYRDVDTLPPHCLAVRPTMSHHRSPAAISGHKRSASLDHSAGSLARSIEIENIEARKNEMYRVPLLATAP